MCIERFEGPRVRTSRIRVGDIFPMHSAAGPRAILAFLPEAQRLSVIEQIYSGESSLAPPALARQELEQRIATAHRVRLTIRTRIRPAVSSG